MFKIKEKQPRKPPSAIIDEFIADVELRRDHHHKAILSLEAVIKEAEERLRNHRIAHDACEEILMNSRINQGLLQSRDEQMIEFAKVT